MSIRWTKTVEVEQQVKLVVDTNPDVEPDDLDELLGALRDATLDDLRKACEAVGLVVRPEPWIDEGLLAQRNEFAARAEKAEARVAELETALRNAAHGIALDEAGPVVYALNARHDEQAAEWESEREELVRTRQETQDKLSEARKELGELGAKLRTSERYVDVHVADLADMRARFSDMRTRAEKAEAQVATLTENDGALFSVCDAIDPHRQPGEPRAETVRRMAADRDALRAKLAALKAPVAGESTTAMLRAMWASNTELANSDTIAEFALAQWRAGHAAGLAASQPTAERATELLSDVQILAMADECYRMRVREDASLSEVRGLAMRVAARVRAERPTCLVTRAVEKNIDVLITIHADGWKIRTSPQTRDAQWKGPNDCEYGLKAADVPATLERMLGGVK